MHWKDKSFMEKFSTIYDSWLELVLQSKHVNPTINAKIAHEIKNPLAIIRSTLQLIESQIPTVKSNKHWGSLYGEIDFINTLIKDFTVLNQSFKIDKQQVDVCGIIEILAHQFEPICKEKNIFLYTSIPKNLPHVDGDQLRLREAFVNIIKNAFEACKAKDTISIIIKRLDNYIIITFTDTGTGIEKDKIDTIYDHFVTYKENGTGLGLAIVKAIIEQHKGSIEVTSEVDYGTSFIVYLPIIAH